MEVDLLIGSNYYWDFTTGDVCHGDKGPVAIHTILGWVWSRAIPVPADQNSPLTFLITHTLTADAPASTERLNEVLHSFWNLESLRIKGAEEAVLDEFIQTIQFKEGCYEVTLPWKDPHPPPPDNFELSQERLMGLLRRLQEIPA